MSKLVAGVTVVIACAVALMPTTSTAASPALTPRDAREAIRVAIEREVTDPRRISVQCSLTSGTRARCNLLGSAGARRYAGTARVVRRGSTTEIVDHYTLRAHGIASGKRRLSIDVRGSVVSPRHAAT